ncbi:hypothetical protein GCM10010145_43370 [Streptomyces ruber]|uniref:Uncharacterized protein n=2 Tax=Streptomyces TaxID=1883 RepID=A0A918ET91_9ACTN|nr:DUF5955 family protein [Streptomyces ruber]GGQ68962.1 hypothetical protein GCM10010145_43370 [Streptomyces ruber]
MRDDGRQDPPVNNGIMISGGTHYVGNQAVGDRAQAFSGSVSFQPRDNERTAELIGRVEQLLDAHRAELGDPEGTAQELSRLREELAAPATPPTVLQRTLERLTALVEPVAPLVTAVGQLAQSVQGLPGL